MILGAISLLLGFAYIAVLTWYFYGWYKSKPQLKNPVQSSFPLSVSVIVPARNEADNIANCLKSLLAQQRINLRFEIMVVDDASEDNTSGIVKAFAVRHPEVKLISLPVSKGVSSKKRAVEAGIDAASGELIVCTDADCTHQPNWLASIAIAYGAGAKKFMAAPVVYHTLPNLLSVFQTLDFMTLQGITAASVATNFHTMCNGANIAYERKVFYEVNGFEGIDRLPTGDDMLLMHKIYKKYPRGISYLRVQDAIVSTDATPTWGSFFQQRIRWASKAAYYDDKRIFWVLLLVYFFNLWFAVLLLIGCWEPLAWGWAVTLLIIKTLAELIFLWPVAGFFNKRKWLWWFPFLQPFHIAYTIVAGWLGRFGSYQWKGRTISRPSDLKA